MKYRFSGETKIYANGLTDHIVRKIIYLYDDGEDFIDGGWIESEENLPQNTSSNNFTIGPDVIIAGKSVVTDSDVRGDSVIYNSILERSYVSCSNIRNTVVKDSALYNTRITNSIVVDRSIIKNSTITTGLMRNAMAVNSSVFKCVVYDAKVKLVYTRNSKIANVSLYDMSRLVRAKILSTSDFLSINNIGSRNDNLKFYRSKIGMVMAVVGCFHGTIEGFERAVHRTHAGNVYEQEYMTAIQLAKIRMKF